MEITSSHNYAILMNKNAYGCRCVFKKWSISYLMVEKKK